MSETFMERCRRLGLEKSSLTDLVDRIETLLIRNEEKTQRINYLTQALQECDAKLGRKPCQNDRCISHGELKHQKDALVLTVQDAINTVRWLKRRLPKGYGDVPHVERTIALCDIALANTSPDEGAA